MINNIFAELEVRLYNPVQTIKSIGFFEWLSMWYVRNDDFEFAVCTPLFEVSVLKSLYEEL